MIQDKKLDKIKNVIIDAVHPDKIILFGSRATGKNREDSDYDIFILKSGIINERTVINTVNRALYKDRIPDEIDLVASNPEKFEKNKDNPYKVYKDIYDQGITIYG
jgi:predicted nucleotidyltransferase